jgi:predicted RNase H-like HicB family nuclease
MRFKVIIEPDNDGFHAKAPALPGCGTWGRTVEEALANIREAIELYLEPEEVTVPEDAEVYEIEVSVE